MIRSMGRNEQDLFTAKRDVKEKVTITDDLQMRANIRKGGRMIREPHHMIIRAVDEFAVMNNPTASTFQKYHTSTEWSSNNYQQRHPEKHSWSW